jgi:glycine hydroxymethyltransferase
MNLGVAVALKEAASAEYTEYATQVQKNAKRLGEELTKLNYDLVTGGTDNHLVLWDLRKLELSGNKMEKLYELASISVNKNAVYGDTSALVPGGVRLGVPALTSRGFKEVDMVTVVGFLDRGIKIAQSIQVKKNL